MDFTMLRITTVLFILFFSSCVWACDCPDVDELDRLNELISEYEAKLRFVAAGYQENRSGFPNKPAILEQEMKSVISERDGLLQDIFVCRKQCVINDAFLKPLLAECPECEDKQISYQDGQEKHAATLATLVNFKQQYRLEDITDLKSTYTKLIRTQKKLVSARLEYKNIQADKNRAQEYKEEVLIPLVKDLNYLENLVPHHGAGFNGPGTPADADAMLSELRRLEKQLADVAFARDSALSALINCNLTLCRTPQNADNLFMPGGLYGPAADSPGWDGKTEPEVLIADAQANKTSPSDPRALLEPDFGSFIVNDDILIDVPEIPADVQEQLAKLAESNEVYIPPGPCELNPPQLCRHLDAQSQDECVTRFTHNNRMCKQFETQMLNASPLAACNGVCDYTQIARLDGLWLLDQIYRTIDQRVASRLDSSDAINRMSLRNKLRQLRVEQSNLQNIPDTRKHLIYKNTQTGRIIEHFGLYFEPQPPLEYVGKEEGERTQEENTRLQTLPGLIIELEKDITSVALADTLLIDWGDQAKSQWQRLMPCQRNQIPESYAMCRISCDVALGSRNDDYRWSSTFCDPAGVTGFLHAPASKAWMYPPN